MAIYAIGDVHGQYEALMRLLETLRYDETKDELWFVGDIINRGPDSIKALRFVTSLKDKIKIVIGNHDFTLMVQAAGLDKGRIKKTTKEILDAPDAQEMISAMHSWPLMVENPALNVVMAHAGVYPYWDLSIARELNARYCEQMKQPEDERKAFLQAIYRNGNGKWKPDASENEKLCFAVNVFARMRFLTSSAKLNFEAKIAPENAEKGLQAWYQEHIKRQDYRIVFGHWAALGLREHEKYACIDGGAAWGGELIAFELGEWKVAAREKIKK